MKLLLTVQYIPNRDSRVIDEVGFRIPRFGFRIPKPWNPDSKGKKMLDSGFPYIGARSAILSDLCVETFILTLLEKHNIIY